MSCKCGSWFIEGRAIIKDVAPRNHKYLVAFFGDPVLRSRIVHPLFQTDPYEIVAVLRALWSEAEASDISDFFPDL